MAKVYKSKKTAYKSKKTVKKITVSKAIKQYVNRQLDNNIQDKLVVQQNTLAGVIQSTSVVLPLIQNLIPPITGGAEVCDRVGNKVRVKRLIYSGHLSRSSLNPSATPQITYLVILRLRTSYDLPVLSEMNSLKYQSTNAGTTSMGGIYSVDYRTLLSPFNKEVFQIVYTKMFKIGNANGTGALWYNNDFKVSQEFRIDLTKHVKKSFVYANLTNNQPENDGLYACWFGVNLDSSVTWLSSTNLDSMSYMNYENA